MFSGSSADLDLVVRLGARRSPVPSGHAPSSGRDRRSPGPDPGHSRRWTAPAQHVLRPPPARGRPGALGGASLLAAFLAAPSGRPRRGGPGLAGLRPGGRACSWSAWSPTRTASSSGGPRAGPGLPQRHRPSTSGTARPGRHRHHAAQPRHLRDLPHAGRSSTRPAAGAGRRRRSSTPRSCCQRGFPPAARFQPDQSHRARAPPPLGTGVLRPHGGCPPWRPPWSPPPWSPRSTTRSCGRRITATAGHGRGPVLGVGCVAVAAVTVLVVALRAPAAARGRGRAWAPCSCGRLDAAARVRAAGRPSGVLGLPVLVGLFGLAVALGTLGRSWSGPGHAALASRCLGHGGGRSHRQRAREQPARGLAPRRPPTPPPLRPAGRAQHRPEPVRHRLAGLGPLVAGCEAAPARARRSDGRTCWVWLSVAAGDHGRRGAAPSRRGGVIGRRR